MSHKKIRDYSDLPLVSRREARENGLIRYFTGQPCKKGHVAPRLVKGSCCLVCASDRSLEWQKKQYLYGPDKFRERNRRNRGKDILNTILRVSRSRAKKRGLEFTVTKLDVNLPETCPCCDRVMVVKSGTFKPGPIASSPSLDRLDSSKGYIPGNVAIICWRCNSLKNNATVDELRNIVRWMENQEPKPRLAVVA